MEEPTTNLSTAANKAPRNPVVRGGFSTSICDLFSDPSRKSDCCALTCCGLFLSDRTHYLALKTEPPPWWRRILRILLVLVFIFSITAPDNAIILNAIVVLVPIVLSIFFLTQCHHRRKQVRLAVMERMNAERQQVDESLSMKNLNVRGGHTCFLFDCCFVKDTDDNNVHDDNEKAHLPRDFCSSLWSWSRYLFFGLGGCWIQCCGMCAVGQEDREMQLLLSKEDFQIDYITFEPYDQYFPKIRDLRISRNYSLWEHVTALSKLSYMLLQTLVIFFLILTVIATIHVGITFEILLVTVATFSQAFLVLYIVHWRYNPFNLSFDAVVKYFSSGFLVCSGMAFAYETFVQMLCVIVLYLFAFIAISIAPRTMEPIITNGPQKYLLDHEKLFELAAGIASFVEAFFTAALVEELAKYFCFWMVEHPDLMSPADMVDTSKPSEANNRDNIENSSAMSQYGSLGIEEKIEERNDNINTEVVKEIYQEQYKRTPLSRARSILVAMVATATGFACCENLLYVFIYSPPGISNDIAVLVTRCLFPLHPIAAAIQSIGVIRRDIEGDLSYGIGRIFLPAFLYHGSFDFAAMFLEYLNKIHAEEAPGQGENSDGISSLFIAFTILGTGIIYYMIQADAQRQRLMDPELVSSKSTPFQSNRNLA